MDGFATFRFPSLLVSEASEQSANRQENRGGADSESTDETLVLQVVEGSREALSILFRRYAGLVRGIAYRILHDTSEADDFVQDLFLLIHRLCESYDLAKGSARSWIVQLTYRRAISRRRYLKRRHFYDHQELNDAEIRGTNGNTATPLENSISGMLGNKNLAEVFQKLSENERQALLLRFVEGYELSEIAEKMGQSRANIKNHYFRGIEKLRKHLFDSKLSGKRAL